jgi:hypothetical protein
VPAFGHGAAHSREGRPVRQRASVEPVYVAEKRDLRDLGTPYVTTRCAIEYGVPEMAEMAKWG